MSTLHSDQILTVVYVFVVCLCMGVCVYSVPFGLQFISYSITLDWLTDLLPAAAEITSHKNLAVIHNRGGHGAEKESPR